MDDMPFEPTPSPDWDNEDDVYFAQMARVAKTVAQFRIYLAQNGIEKVLASDLTRDFFSFLLESGELG